MRRLCLVIAASMLAATVALGARAEGPPPYDGPLIVEVYRVTAVVDGVPVLRPEWIAWDGQGWVPVPERRVRPRERPISRHQRRLE